MRIAVLAHSFPRFAGDTHGPFVQRLSESLADRGHEVHVLVPYDPALQLDSAGSLRLHTFRYFGPGAWHRLGYSRTLDRDVRLKVIAAMQAPFYFVFGTRALRRLVRRERIDLVHAHWILPNGYLAARSAAATGVPFAATLHGSDVFMAERNAVFRRLARRALAQARYVTSCSADLRERLLAVGGEEHRSKILLVPNGTDLVPDPAAGRNEARQRWKIAPDETALVAVGRLVDKKGFGFLLEALPRIVARYPRVRLLLGGEGPLRAELERVATARGLTSKVELTGLLSHPEVLDLLRAADLFVMPSVRDPQGNIDGLPVVVLEAMAAARPVVATEVAGMPLAVVDGETGRLVPPGDPEALAAAIVALLENPARAAEMGRAGRQRVEDELNWAAVARVHDDLLRAALQEPSEGARP